MSALISVIVPVYNRANYLPECVDSLLKQTYSNLEIILIDDGSTRFREDLFIGEDFYFIYENLIKGASSVIIPRRLYFCRHHDSNATDVYTYASFQNRWLRRQLVWENEQQLGREGNANMQKISTFYVYLNAILSGQMPKPEQKLMISFMKKNRKTLLSAMGFGMKLRFYLHVWLPFTYPLSYKLKRKLKKSHR